MNNKKAYCNSCKERREFEFYKSQLKNGKRLFDIYNCPTCKTSRSFNETEHWRKLMGLEVRVE